MTRDTELDLCLDKRCRTFEVRWFWLRECFYWYRLPRCFYVGDIRLTLSNPGPLEQREGLRMILFLTSCCIGTVRVSRGCPHTVLLYRARGRYGEITILVDVELGEPDLRILRAPNAYDLLEEVATVTLLFILSYGDGPPDGIRSAFLFLFVKG